MSSALARVRVIVLGNADAGDDAAALSVIDALATGAQTANATTGEASCC